MRPAIPQDKQYDNPRGIISNRYLKKGQDLFMKSKLFGGGIGVSEEQELSQPRNPRTGKVHREEVRDGREI